VKTVQLGLYKACERIGSKKNGAERARKSIEREQDLKKYG